MKKEIICLDGDGSIQTEMLGFKGNDCLKEANNISKELKDLGITTNIDAIKLKDNVEDPQASSLIEKQKIEES